MFIMNGIIALHHRRRRTELRRWRALPDLGGDFKAATGLAEGLAIKTTQALTVVTAVIVVAVLFWFLNRTRTGKSMRAFSDNEDLALLSGINPERVVAVTWIIAAALATIAGVLYGLDKSFKPFTYFQLLLPIFAAAIVGGLGSPLGAIAGGFVIAFCEVMVTYAWKKVLGYLLPEGLAPDEPRAAAVHRLQVRRQLHDPDHRAAVHADRALQGEIGMNHAQPRALCRRGACCSWSPGCGSKLEPRRCAILNMSLISAIMAMGVNIQWGYAGLFNVGIMGFVALGGLAVVLTSAMPLARGLAGGRAGHRAGPAPGRGDAGAGDLRLTSACLRGGRGRWRCLRSSSAVSSYTAPCSIPRSMAVEANNPEACGQPRRSGPARRWWPGRWAALLAAAAAWAIGKTALGLRSDYLAIATLGIAEIIIAVLKNEDWLARGVKNVITLPRPWPVPYEVELQRNPASSTWAASWGFDPVADLVHRRQAGLCASVRPRAAGHRAGCPSVRCARPGAG